MKQFWKDTANWSRSYLLLRRKGGGTSCFPETLLVIEGETNKAGCSHVWGEQEGQLDKGIRAEINISGCHDFVSSWLKHPECLIACFNSNWEPSVSNQKTFLCFWTNFRGEIVISMTWQANQAGHILPAILTTGTEQAPGTGAEDKRSCQLAWSYSFSCAGAAVLARIRKMQGTQGRGGARSVTM